jgi:hypothetical protein
LVTAGARPGAWAAAPPASKLLPDRTVAFLSVANAPDMARRFQNTALGRMSQDPQLRPVLNHLYGSLGEFVGQFKQSIGVSLPELLSIPQGEVALAVVAVDEGPPAVVLVLDTGNRTAVARTLLSRGGDALRTAGAKRSEETYLGTTLTVFDPPDEPQIRVAWFEKEGTIVAGSNLEVVKGVLAAWSGPTGDTSRPSSKTLASDPKFSQITARCRGVRGEEPQLSWYVDPIGLFRAMGRQSPGLQLALMMVLRLGIDGFQGIGGSWALDCGSLDDVVHTHVLLDSPRGGVLELIGLEPGDYAAEPWVPGDVASYTTLHWRIEATYKAIARLWDSFRGEGSFANLVDRRVSGAAGIDVAKEILPALDGRVTYVTWMEKPISPTSQVYLVGLRLKNNEARQTVAKALQAVFKKNEQALKRVGAAGNEFYQVILPERGPGRSTQRVPGGPPELCFGVLENYLVVTTRPSLYFKAIATLETPDDALGSAMDFKLVMSKISDRKGLSKPAAVIFQRPEEGYRFLYTMITGTESRENLRRSAERSGFMRTINSALEANPLPPFAVLERYLAPAGAYIIDDVSGLHYSGFTLRRK